MRVLQIVQKPQPRGAEVFAFQLSECLEELGHEASSVYLYGYSGPSALALRPGDVGLRGREDHPFERRLSFHPGLLRRLAAVIRERRPRIVVANGSRTVKYGALCRLFHPGRSWRLVYRNIDDPRYWVRDPVRRWFYRRVVMPQVDGVIGVSEATLEGVRRLYRITAPAAAVPNGVDPRRAVPAEGELPVTGPRDPSTTGLLLFFGSLTMQKRPDRFLRIVQAVGGSRPGLQAWILGDGPLRDSLVRDAAALGLEGSVRFCGYQERIAPYLAAADLLLVTSDSEGIPAVALEAAFAAVPTVGTDVGGMRECVVDGKTGRLVSREDEAGFAAAVLGLLADPPARRALGEEARRAARERFDINRIAGRYVAFFAEIIAGGGGRARRPGAKERGAQR